MIDYLKPNEYFIFKAIGLENRVVWNNEIHIGSLMYRMVGVTKYSPNHFHGDVFDPATKTWLHFNSIPENKKDRANGFTLKPILLKRRKVLNIEGLFRDANCVHYVRIE